MDIIINHDNLISAVVQLVTLAKDNGMQEQAVQILAECGIGLDIVTKE